MAEGPVHGGAAGAMAKLFEIVDELLSLEQAGLAEDGVKDHGPFGGELELPDMEVTTEEGAYGFVGKGLAALLLG